MDLERERLWHLVVKYEAQPGAGQGRRAQKNNPHLAAQLEVIDRGVGMIVDKLDELDLLENTILIFTSDNGGEVRVSTNAPLRAGKSTLYEGGIREPLIVHWPGVVAPGTLCRVPVCSVDFFPTLLELAGVHPTECQKLDGVSLVPLLKNPQADWAHYARTSFGPGNYAIVSEDYRYIHYNDGSEEFYDRTKDTHEWNNVITNPEYAGLIKKHRAQIPQERHEVLGQKSTGHKSFEASEAVNRGEPIPADKPVKKNRRK